MSGDLNQVMLTATVLAMGTALPTAKKTHREMITETVPPEKQFTELPHVIEMKDLKRQIELMFLPAFRDLYFAYYDNGTFLMNKKMAKMKSRLKRAKTPYAALKILYVYLRKYRKHVQDLRDFSLTTDIEILQKTLSDRLYLWKDLDNKLDILTTEVLESINDMEVYERDTAKSVRKRLLPFNNHGDLSYMKNCDIYFLYHIREFLDSALTELKRLDHIWTHQQQLSHVSNES